MASIRIKTDSKVGSSVQWWENFLSFAINRKAEEGLYQVLTWNYVNFSLKEYKGKVIFYDNVEYVIFESEEDATAFILKWS